MNKKLSVKEKVQKYYNEHPLVEVYKGWNIRKYSWEARYLGTLTNYTCDVKPGVESCQASTIEFVREWIDQKIKEGKIQKEDLDMLS